MEILYSMNPRYQCKFFDALSHWYMKKLYMHTTLVYKLSSSSSLWLFELSKFKMVKYLDILIDLVKWKTPESWFLNKFQGLCETD